MIRHVHVVPTVCPNVQLGGVFDIGNWLPGCAQGVLVLSIARTSPAIYRFILKKRVQSFMLIMPGPLMLTISAMMV